jgi:perosamine synthetase
MEFIPIANTYIGEEEARAVYEVVKSGWISMGKKVKSFEEAVCQYTGAKYAVAMNSGTSTLHSILAALGIGSGDEVILPTLTYISSANVVLFQGASPVLSECDPRTFNVEPEHVKKKITQKTKAFMTVDLKGMPVDYDAFVDLSKDTGIPFIADSAESLGAVYKDKKVGNQAYAHYFSFFANKNITTGEGGMVTTNDEDLYKKLLIIRNQGQEGRYKHTWLGNNYRLTDIQAAFGIEQLKRVDWLLSEKQKLADRYSEAFSKMEGIEPPFVPDYVSRHSWYMFSIKMDVNKRDELIEYLHAKNVDTRLSFPPIHIQPYYRKRFGYKPEDFPVSYQTFSRFLDIPIWVGLGKDKQDYIINAIESFLSP